MPDLISILVAEDNSISQFMITKILKRMGMDVDVVDNGNKVLESLRNKNYDLILMDSHMPVMDGLEATRIIRREFSEPQKSIPIISLSASIMEDEHQAAIIAGANDVVTKPFDPLILQQKIMELIQKNLPVVS